MFNVQCEISHVQCTIFNIQCAMFNLQSSILQCAMWKCGWSGNLSARLFLTVSVDRWAGRAHCIKRNTHTPPRSNGNTQTQRHTQTQRQTHIQGVFFNWREQSGAVDLCECQATKVWKANKQMLFLRFIQNLKFKCKDFWRNSNSVEWSEQSGAVDLCECRAREARRADAPKVKPLLSAPKKNTNANCIFLQHTKPLFPNSCAWILKH